MTMLAAIIAAVSAIAAIAGAVISNRNVRAVRSAYAAMMSAQKPSDRTLPVVVGIANKKTGWVRTFVEASGTWFGIVLAILFSLAFGVGFNVLLSQNDSPSALIPTFSFAGSASTTPVSASPFPTAAATEPASAAPVLAPPFPTAAAEPASTTPVAAPPFTSAAAAEPENTAPVSAPPFTTGAATEPASAALVSAPRFTAATAAEPDRSEVAALLARGRATLSTGDAAGARVYLRRAAEHNDPQAALALGETYDPAVLRHLGVIKFNADVALAREWFSRAADLGSAAAVSRLDQLSKTDQIRQE